MGDSTLGATKSGADEAGVVIAAGEKFVSPVVPGMVIEPRVSSVGTPIRLNFSTRPGVAAGSGAGVASTAGTEGGGATTGNSCSPACGGVFSVSCGSAGGAAAELDGPTIPLAGTALDAGGTLEVVPGCNAGSAGGAADALAAGCGVDCAAIAGTGWSSAPGKVGIPCDAWIAVLAPGVAAAPSAGREGWPATAEAG